MYGYIYKTINLINDKIYIGQKKSKVFKGNSYLGSGKSLKLAIGRYGKENFKVELLEEIDCAEKMDEREIYWIEYFNSTNRDIGYSISNGGNVNRSMSGEHNPMYGKHQSSKVIEIMKNREFSKETRYKMSIAKKNRGLGKENNNAKPVVQLTKEYKVIKQYPSLVDAANETGYNYNYLREATEHKKRIRNGKITFREFTYGYRWLKITEWEELKCQQNIS